jgi:hypothetical protein
MQTHLIVVLGIFDNFFDTRSQWTSVGSDSRCRSHPPSGRGFTSNSPLWKVQASAGEQYPPARWSRTTASTVPTTTLKAEDVLEAEIFIKWQAESSCHIGLLGCSMGLTVS